MKDQKNFRVIAILLILSFCALSSVPLFQVQDVSAQTAADCNNAWEDCKENAKDAYDECTQNGWSFACALDLAQALLHCAEAAYDCLRWLL